MSSHREAPSISKDPTADNTDVYAFISKDKQDTTTIVANFVPQQGPAAGPNFFEFDPSVTYYIYVDRTGDGVPDVTYAFTFTTNYATAASQSFLYNTGTITASGSGTGTVYKNYSVPQTYTVTRVTAAGSTPLVTGAPVPPCNVGIHSTPNYAALATPAITPLSGGGQVFAGQRADPFYADLGAIFDLADIRPIQFLHTGPLAAAFAKNNLRGLNVLSIVLQVPTTELVGGPVPTDYKATNAVVGIWSAAARPASRMYRAGQPPLDSGGAVQVSRLGNPLVNEVLVPLTRKDAWNASTPAQDSAFSDGIANPALAGLLNVLYPNVFGFLAARSATGKARADLLAILLTGLPDGIIPGLKTQIGASTTLADMLRLNVAIKPTDQPKPFGVLAGDLQGYPNGRRLDDDVVGIELRAIAGATLPLVEPDYKVDLAVRALDDFAPNDNGQLLPSFPYLALPNSGFDSDPSRYSSGS